MINKSNKIKMIQLSEAEKKLIKLCKNHYADDDRFKKLNGWINILKPMHNEIYGWDANEHYEDFLRCAFGKLFDIYMKIGKDESGSNIRLKSIFFDSFDKRCRHKKPIERAIAALCSEIRHTDYLDDNEKPRYSLELK